jgi:DNA-binding response OmpR family regulator
VTDLREMMEVVLREAGYHVQGAATGADALRLAAGQPDLIVLDVDLPGY